jgi:hypothetical protein
MAHLNVFVVLDVIIILELRQLLNSFLAQEAMIAALSWH